MELPHAAQTLDRPQEYLYLSQTFLHQPILGDSFVLGLSLLAAAPYSMPDDPVLAWILIALGASLFLSSFLLPMFYVIDDHGIRIYYLFVIRESFFWNTLEEVSVIYPYSRRAFPYIFDTFFFWGGQKVTGPDLFFISSTIPRTLRARILIERRLGKPIEGFVLREFKQDVQTSVTKWHNKMAVKSPDAKQVSHLEKTSRSAIQKVLAKHPDAPNPLFFYLCSDQKSTTRPLHHYTYCVQIGDKLFPLVKVKARRKAYKGRLCYEDESLLAQTLLP